MAACSSTDTYYHSKIAEISEALIRGTEVEIAIPSFEKHELFHRIIEHFTSFGFEITASPSSFVITPPLDSPY